MNAKGTFEVKIIPQQDRTVPGLGRMTIDKTFFGDLSGMSQGQMLSGGDPKTGSVGYVAMERFEGKLHDKKGSFILQHSATMNDGAHELAVTIVPKSGTDELKGIAGSLVILNDGGKHSYVLDYRLP